MERKSLKRFGEAILTVHPPNSSCVANYFMVTHTDQVAGVGLFHDANEDCTVAMVRDVDGLKMTLAYCADKYPINYNDIEQLKKIYESKFSR